MKISTRGGKIILAGGKILGDCACCAKCCWRVAHIQGCPGPKVTVSDGGKEVLICFQDSEQCGAAACESDQEDASGCGGQVPCGLRQQVVLATTFVAKEPGTVTVSIEGNVEAGNAVRGYDATVVWVTDSCGVEGYLAISSADAITEEVGAGSCKMFDVSRSKTFPVAAGCVHVSINSDTWDALWHFGMYSKVTLEFSGEVTACDDGLCTDLECKTSVVRAKSQDETTGVDGVVGGVGDCYGVDGEADKCGTWIEVKTCVPVDKPDGGGNTEDCKADCAEGECETIQFYCCPQKTADGQTPVVGQSRDCKAKQWRVCSTEFLGATDTEIPNGAYRTLAECREACPPEGYECIDNVCTASDDPDATYKTLEECEAACFGRFFCNPTGECIQTSSQDAPYADRQECEALCETRWSCAPNGGCYASPDGQYDTLEECEAACEPPGTQYWCVLRQGVQQCSSTPPTQQEIQQGLVFGGPYDSAAICLDSCRRFSCLAECGGAVKCVPSPTGAYATRQDCLAGCADPAAVPCTLMTSHGTSAGVFPFVIDAAPRDVCLSYVSKKGQPIKATIRWPVIDKQTCQPTGIATLDSGWRGEKTCDCPDERPVRVKGPIDGPPKGSVSWRKNRGVTYFWVTIFAPCPGTEVEWTIQCVKGPCEEAEDPEPLGACCEADGDCVNGLTKQECLDAGGKWKGPCTTCGPNSCPKRKGACCLPDGTCERRTREECEAAGGVYQGDGVLCQNVVCPPPPPTGACCFAPGCDEGHTRAICEAFGGYYLGDGTTCGPPDECLGACCVGDVCHDGMTQSDCELMGGKWKGRGTHCNTIVCTVPCTECDPDQWTQSPIYNNRGTPTTAQLAPCCAHTNPDTVAHVIGTPANNGTWIGQSMAGLPPGADRTNGTYGNRGNEWRFHTSSCNAGQPTSYGSGCVLDKGNNLCNAPGEPQPWNCPEWTVETDCPEQQFAMGFRGDGVNRCQGFSPACLPPLISSFRYKLYFDGDEAGDFASNEGWRYICKPPGATKVKIKIYNLNVAYTGAYLSQQAAVDNNTLCFPDAPFPCVFRAPADQHEPAWQFYASCQPESANYNVGDVCAEFCEDNPLP